MAGAAEEEGENCPRGRTEMSPSRRCRFTRTKSCSGGGAGSTAAAIPGGNSSREDVAVFISELLPRLYRVGLVCRPTAANQAGQGVYSCSKNSHQTEMNELSRS